MTNKVIPVPKEIDIQIAFDALNAMNVKIDKLSNEQLRYMNSWN
jgi:adenosylhomocysteinase